MKRKRLFLLLASTCLVLVLAVSPFMAACAKPAVETGAAEIAALEKEIAKLEAAAPEPAEVYNWKLQVSWPAVTADKRFTPFVEHVKAMSGGRININLHYANELVPNADVAYAIKDRIMELGHTWPKYYGSDIAIGYFLNGLTFAWQTPQQAAILLNKPEILEMAREAFAELGSYYLGPVLVTPAKLVSTKPVRSLEDWRPLITRATATSAKIVESLGISSSPLPSGEIYSAYQKGMIDASLMGAAMYGVDMGYFEVAKYMVDNIPFSSPAVSTVLINLDIWNSLPEDLQQSLTTAVVELSWYISNMVEEGELLAREVARDEMGVEFTLMNEKDLAVVYEAGIKFWDEAAAQSLRAAKAVEMLKDWNRTLGYMK